MSECKSWEKADLGSVCTCACVNGEICPLRLVQKLTEALEGREEEVMSLHDERDALTRRVTELEEELRVSSMSLQQKEKDVKVR